MAGGARLRGQAARAVTREVWDERAAVSWWPFFLGVRGSGGAVCPVLALRRSRSMDKGSTDGPNTVRPNTGCPNPNTGRLGAARHLFSARGLRV